MRTFFDYLGFIITSFGTILGGIGIYISVNEKPDWGFIQFGLIFLTCLFLLLFLWFLRASIRNRRYKKAYCEINKAFAIVNELNENEHKMDDLSNCIKVFEVFCTHVKRSFQIITNKSCSTCIKLFEPDEKADACTFTFCRDADSMIDDKRVKPDEDNINHYLRDNTDFRFIFENIDKTGENYKYYINVV